LALRRRRRFELRSMHPFVKVLITPSEVVDFVSDINLVGALIVPIGKGWKKIPGAFATSF